MKIWTKAELESIRFEFNLTYRSRGLKVSSQVKFKLGDISEFEFLTLQKMLEKILNNKTKKKYEKRSSKNRARSVNMV